MMIDELPPTLTRVDPATQRSAEYIRADVARAQIDAANAYIAQLREALQELCDLQNGPPSVRDADRWLAAMDSARGWLETVGWASAHGSWNLTGWSGEGITHWMPLPPPPVTP